jgi:mono/diheme cytochrome c family protein
MNPRPILLAMVGVAFALAALSLAQEVTIKRAPAPYTQAASGQQMYESYCASCHGKNGQGDGPAAPALKVSPPNLTEMAEKSGGKFPDAHVAAVIRGEPDMPAHGSREMPVWGPVFRSVSRGDAGEVHLRVTNLTKYIRSLQKD